MHLKNTVLNYNFSVYRYQNEYESNHIIYHSKALGMYYHNLGGNVAPLDAAQRYDNK